MEASSSTADVIFRISDGSNQSENDVRIKQPHCLRRWSLGLRRLMDDGASSQQISLKVDPKSGFDSAAVEWVLEKLQQQALDVTSDERPIQKHLKDTAPCFGTIRNEELRKLVERVYFAIFEIHEDNKKLAKSIRETLKQHELGNFSKWWKEIAKELEKEKLTPCDFLRELENVLAPEPQIRGLEPRDRVRARARDVPRVNWVNLFSIIINAMKETPHVIDGKEIGGDKERKDGILNSLEELIQERCHALAAKLMTKMDSIVQGWKDELEKLDLLNPQA
ncbi:hypothetical protein OIDMADRAFT_61686 [Oidiodendron maius Zn]|uniref:Uncharacterized protein n=1 Tax=Oidiodendron maius (strain Zn) TaxID=913774 RepID=A0A0C3CUF1_OIDMZ|nr:hypothetical protein OIDMADRAFT_61686 [Oidiodendron maius Zn]